MFLPLRIVPEIPLRSDSSPKSPPAGLLPRATQNETSGEYHHPHVCDSTLYLMYCQASSGEIDRDKKVARRKSAATPGGQEKEVLRNTLLTGNIEKKGA